MEDQEMVAEANAPKEVSASYTIRCFAGVELPAQYQGLVFSKWLRSLRYGNDYFRIIEQEAFFQVYNKYIESILSRQNTIVNLAVLSDDEDVVLGFSVNQPQVLHYVHVQKDQRRQGIGKSLVPPNIHTITHVTNIGLSIWGSKRPDWKFNPFI